MIDPTRLSAVSQAEIDHLARTVSRRPSAAWVDRKRGVCVQMFDDCHGCEGTPWNGTLRVGVKHTRAKTPAQASRRGYDLPVTWDDMQAIKEHLWPGRIGLEIFPPKDQLVDVADMRWIWVLPPGSILPFNLTGQDTLTS